MFGGFKQTKLKPALKMAVHRFQIASNKKIALTVQQKREIAKLLGERPIPKEEKARIRAEALIREDNTVEAYEIMQLECELLAERIKLISSQKECPPDLVSCVSTLIWASERVDVIELVEIRKQFRSKYGKKFEEAALANSGGVLNERVFAKLSVQPPSAHLVQTYLERIADEFNVDWQPVQPVRIEDMDGPMTAPNGYSVPVAHASALGGPTDEEINYPGSGGRNNSDHGFGNGSAGDGGEGVPVTAFALPSPAPTLPPGKPDHASSSASVEPVYPTPMPPPVAPPMDDYEQPDIPAAPKDGAGSFRGGKDDDEDGHDNGNGGSTNPSYDDLASRFAQLKK